MLPAEPHLHPAPLAEAAVAPPPASWLEQLLGFLCYTVLPAVPRGLWLAGSGALFSCINLLLLEEVWPNTPKAEPVFSTAFVLCAVPVPWLLGFTTYRVAAALQNWKWRMLWQLVYACCFVGACLLLIPECIGVFILLSSL
ncbi:hypothetical protein [Hymenobacter weizhouensis]|uniref:hypothetical protein n=1 Tax=Hymenobacter sp. YIM 151500-1 TaxID=2987689 RepID=UPI00222764AF|nr:hypothetical protein [Hymenobacter sp. YIM 151500-1]UYZ63188.1 hypothetical protein OIS53_19625 [Hymenobacter sp. YIM 151500-1]